MDFLERFADPPRKYTLVPFWFLNDALEEGELKRQLDSFAAHGVYGVVPHARIGLPESIGWMSDRWLGFLRTITEHCAHNGMMVILYDEGMYPSGSCCGQVVAANPRHAARCIERRRKPARLEEGEEAVAEDEGYIYVHARSMGHIRGIHFGQDDGEPGAPPAGDLLNPESVASFLHLTHDRHYEVLGEYFGNTIQGIFTDEPSMLGRGARRGVKPWTWGFGDYLEQRLGYDFRPHLAALWDNRYPEAEGYRRDFEAAVHSRLDQVYYGAYGKWCGDHGVALTGHPEGPMDIGVMRHFHWPGQDVVWRYLEPFEDKSLEGPQSTMGKSSSSAQVNHGRERNLNEYLGAYGWELTYEEMKWLTDWLLVRGTNLLAPHAYYYSIRGKRRDERPPDVGPNNTWWDQYKSYADYCRRLCWLLAEGRHVCPIAILGTPSRLPWRAARVCFEHQRDFNYLDTGTLGERAEVSAGAVAVGPMRYACIIADGAGHVTQEALERLAPMVEAGRVAAYGEPIEGIPEHLARPAELLEWMNGHAPPDLVIEPPQHGLRYRHVRLAGRELYFMTNEGPEPVDAALKAPVPGAGSRWLNPHNGEVIGEAPAGRVRLAPYEAAVLETPPA